MATLMQEIRADARADNNRGARKLYLIGKAIAHMEAEGDWTYLAWIVALASDTDRSRIKRIIDAACGVTFKSDTKQPSGLKAVKPREGANVFAAGAQALAYHIAEGNTFRSKVLEESHGDIPALLAKTEKAFDLMKAMEALYKRAEKEGIPPEAVRAAATSVCAARRAAETENDAA